MEGTTVRIFKIFTAWQDDKEEAWLRQMSQQGLHLTQPLFPCVYTFVRGAAADNAYRLDYIPRLSTAEFDAYVQVFRDAGWEHVGQMAGWQYFRKPVRAGEPDEIYTDSDSKVRKYRRLLSWVILLVLGLAVTMTSSGDRPQTAFFEAVTILQFAVLVLMA